MPMILAMKTQSTAQPWKNQAIPVAMTKSIVTETIQARSRSTQSDHGGLQSHPAATSHSSDDDKRKSAGKQKSAYAFTTVHKVQT
eukprot:3260719-Amphidinium_carterae.1